MNLEAESHDMNISFLIPSTVADDLEKDIETMFTEYIACKQNERTKRIYTSHFYQLIKQSFLIKSMKLIEFANTQNTNRILDLIRQTSQKIKPAKKQRFPATTRRKKTQEQISLASESVRQARAAFFIGFTKFMARRTNDTIKAAQPNRDGDLKTFSHRNQKSVAKELTEEQLKLFFGTLQKMGQREYLFASLQFIGARRLAEVRQSNIENINWEESKIYFKPNKSGKVVPTLIPIKMPQSLLDKLKSYLGNRLLESATQES